MDDARRYGDLELIGRLIRQARPYWNHLLGVILIGIAATPITLLAPLPLKLVVDSVLGEHPLPWPLTDLVAGAADPRGAALLVAAVMLVVVTLLAQGHGLVEWLYSSWVGQKIVLDFRARLFRHAQRLSLAYHDTQGSADSIYRIQYDTSSIQHILVDGLIPLFSAGLTLVGIFLVAAQIDPSLALIAMAVSPVLFILSRAYSRPLRRRWRNVKELQTSSLSVVQEVLGALRVVKAFGQERREEERFITTSQRALGAQVRVSAVEGGFKLLVGATTGIGAAAVLIVGANLVRSGTLTLGELLMVMTYLTQLYGPLKTISSKAADLQSSMAGAERSFRLLDEQPDVVDRPNARPLQRAVGAVEVRNLRFAYGSGRDVLSDVNLDIAPGTRVGISGQTGAGKSTFMNLLCRFYDPQDGAILLDGIDLREYRLADLRAQFSIVLQEPVLFPTTIAENIAYARPDAGPWEIEEAARAANAHEFIADLPEGYDTRVGERGLRLSGGERQRISIARAFLRDAPILVLDEPTSSVDMQTEAKIMEAMWRLMAGRTTFMIAHRLSTLTACDRRLRIADGHVIDWVPQTEDFELQPSSVHDEPVGWMSVVRRTSANTRRQQLTRLFARRGSRPAR